MRARRGGVLTTGEVVWKQDAAKGGEFGIRFTELDPQSAEALQRVIGIACAPAAPAKGNRVRLHIEGLGSPMRAHVKESRPGILTAFSGLGFLQVGKHLELEDASTGAKRPAKVVRVECEIDPASKVPQLVMSFQYEDEQVTPVDAAREDTPEPMVTHDEPAATDAADESIDRASSEMKGFVARNASKVTPALERLFARAKTTAALLAAKHRGGSGDDVAIPLRRRTSPPPQGGLHASGRTVVRDSLPSAKEIPENVPLKTWSAKRIGIAVGVVGGHPRRSDRAPQAEHDGAGRRWTRPARPGRPSRRRRRRPPLSAPPSVLSPVTPPAAPNAPTAGVTEVPANDVFDDPSDTSHGRHRSRVAPFSNGAVSHGNVLRIKMDGEIDKIEGDGQPTGFTVVVPGRRSLEPAAPLAARDARIASIRVTNDGSGAELTLAFSDRRPQLPRFALKGDVLEIVLAADGHRSPGVQPTRATTAPAARPPPPQAPRQVS